MRPPRPFVARKCGIKIGYETYQEAFRIARRHWTRYSDKMVPYECPLCGKFHIGHQKTEQDLSTAFVPLRKAPPESKPKKVKQPPPVKKVKEVLAYYPPEDPFKKMEIRASNRAQNECQRVAAIERRKEKIARHAETMAHSKWLKDGGYMWWVACDDGWNQHL